MKCKPFYFLILALFWSNRTWSQGNAADTTTVNGLLSLSHFYAANDPYLSLKYSEDALKLAQQTGNDSAQTAAYGKISRVYLFMDDNVLAMENLLKGLHIAEKAGDSLGISSMYNSIGLIYSSRYAYDSALVYFTKALGIRKRKGNTIGVAQSLNGIGACYEKLFRYRDCYDTYLQAYNLAVSEKNEEGIGIMTNNLAGILRLMKRSSEAVPLYFYTLKQAYSQRHPFNIAFASRNIGNTYLEIGQPDSAEYFLLRATKIADSIKSVDIQTACYSSLQKFYAKQGRYQLANDYALLFQALSDSLNAVESQKRINAMQANYNAKKKENENALLRKENQLQWLYLMIGLGSGVFLLIVLALFYNRYRLKARTNRLLNEANEQLVFAYDQLEKDNRRKSAELAEARDLQRSMLPTSTPDYPPLEIAVWMQTATEVGGDYYDFYLSDDGSFHLVVGDATGHGLRAAFLVAVAKSYYQSFGAQTDERAFLKQLSAGIARMNLKEMFMALALARYKEDELTIFSAGMPPVYIYRRATGEVETVSINGLLLGFPMELPFDSQTVQMQTGDLAVFMSDGFTDVRNDQKEMIGDKRIPELIKSFKPVSARQLTDSLADYVLAHVGARAFEDDVTLAVICKR